MFAPDEKFSLAVHLYTAGQFPQAEQVVLELLRGNPQHAEAWRMLAGLAFKRNDPERGFEFLNRSLQCNARNPETWLNLADYSSRVGDIAATIRSCEQALRLDSHSLAAYLRLAAAYRSVGKWNKAAHALEQAARLAPDDNDISFGLASIHHESGEAERAMLGYRALLGRDPFHFGAATGLARALFEHGHIDEGIAQFRLSLRLQPNQPSVYFFLSNLAAEGWCALSREELDRIHLIVGSSAASAADRSDCAFALALVLRQRGDHGEAMRYYRLANDLRRRVLHEQGISFDAPRHEAMVDRIIATFDRKYFESVRGWGDPSEMPVFIVGMPRSGSTLVEQILASHPRAHGIGEIGDVQILAAKVGVAASTELYDIPEVKSPRDAQALATGYINWARRLHATADRIANKTLQNFLYLGLIATAFPNARIVQCRRDPLDTCLSCYFANFRAIPFSCSLTDIAAYYRSYDRLMDHWSRVLPAPIHEVRYESLVEQPKPNIEKLIAHCGLPWDDRCLEFYKSKRTVMTASAAQVRKPIYKSAVGRWHHYQSELGPLLSLLGMKAGPIAASTVEGTAVTSTVSDNLGGISFGRK